MSNTLPSETQRGIWAAIRDAPFDDVPRLIYADWLDENGESERAELIRIQCEQCSLALPPDSRAKRKERARLDARAGKLIDEHGKRWLAGIRAILNLAHPSLDSKVRGLFRFRRGLVDAQPCGLVFVRKLAAAGDTVEPCDRIWIGETSWDRNYNSLVEIGRWQGAAAITGISLNGADSIVATIVSAPHLRNLANLGLMGPGVTDNGVAKLADWRRAAALRTIDLRGASITDAAALALAASAHIGKLCMLDISRTQISAAGEQQLRKRFGSAVQMFSWR